VTQDIVSAEHSSIDPGLCPGPALLLEWIFREPLGLPIQPDEPSRSSPLGLRVLVVEENPRDRAWLADTLAKRGFEVREAATGAEGIHLCCAMPFDAIVLDLCLPELTCEHFLRDVRESLFNHGTPVIVIAVRDDDAAEPDVSAAPGQIAIARFIAGARLLTGD
jgi:CheY-like chemotaxis protein